MNFLNKYTIGPPTRAHFFKFMKFCIKEHQEYHITILYTNKNTPEAVYCERCNWILQKQNDEWNLKQTFIK